MSINTKGEYPYTDQKRIQAFWKENIMYNECICMLQRGAEISGRTLFVPKGIISIKDYALNKEYVPGRDFQWMEGTNKILWLKGSEIPYFYEGALEGLAKEGGCEYVKDWDGSMDESGRSRLGGVLYCVGPFLYQRQLAITYEYDINDAKQIYRTPYQGDKLPKTIEKLSSKEQLRIVFYGSSTFQGADASGFHNRAPYMPVMADLVGQYLSNNGYNVTVTNLGVGGWSTAAGLAALKGDSSYIYNGESKTVYGPDFLPLGTKYKDFVQKGEYDLVIWGFFAGNDYGSGLMEQDFESNMKAMMEIFRRHNPACEFMLLTGMVTNPYPEYMERFVQKTYGLAQGHALVDMYKTHKDILKTKDFIATSGNNINHGNDWLIRLTAHNVLSAMVADFG